MPNKIRSLPEVQQTSNIAPSSRSNPLREISRLQRNIDRMFDNFLAPVSDLFSSQEQMGFVPLCDVEETNDHYMLSFDLPGVSKDNIKIEMNDSQLVVSGERKEEHERKEGTTVSSERSYGSFQRYFTLPSNVQIDKIEASYQDGVLRVGIPKVASAKPKAIEIKEHKAGMLGRILGHDKKKESEKAA